MAPRRKPSLSSVKTEAYPLLNREALGSLKALWRASHVDRDDPETEIAACDFWMRLAGLVAQELPAWQEVTAQIADALIARFPRPVAERDWASFAHGLMIATAISGDGRYQEPQSVLHDGAEVKYTCEQIISLLNEQHREVEALARLAGWRGWFAARYGPTFEDGEFFYTFGIEAPGAVASPTSGRPWPTSPSRGPCAASTTSRTWTGTANPR